MQPIADGKVIHAGTMNSGQPSIAAALATIDVLEREQVHPRLFELGKTLMEGLRDASKRAGKPMLVQGMGPMFHTGFTSKTEVRDLRDTLSYDKPQYAAFVAGMQDRGIRLIGRGLWYLSGAHTPADIENCISTAYDVLRGL
jgi:glutamate-1-semialdehyde 2,1-aminomutase